MKSELSGIDIFWSYLSKLSVLLSGLVSLPVILRYLTAEEIAINYLFLNIISFSVIFDMGFSLQFSRNVGFVYGGASDIMSVGYVHNNTNNGVDYRLLKNVISSAQYLYQRISLFVLLILFSIGSFYVFNMVEGYGKSRDMYFMWPVFVVLLSFDFYYKYYTPLLQGKGEITAINKIKSYSSIVRALLTMSLLFLGFRLWAVLIGILGGIIITRVMSVYEFYHKDKLQDKIGGIEVSLSQKKMMIKKLWTNAKKTALVQVASFISTQLGFFVVGLYLSATEVSSYGLLMQLVSVVSLTSMALSEQVVPIYSQLRAHNDTYVLKKNFYFTTGMYYILFLVGSSLILFFGPFLLDIIKSNVGLPSLLIIIIYILYKFLEGQHCICIFCISSKNKVYDMESAILMAVATVLLFYITLDVLNLGLFGIVLSQFVIALSYANWKWPMELCKEFKINFLQMILYSIQEALSSLKNIMVLCNRIKR